jgi:hypothetical protein
MEIGNIDGDIAIDLTHLSAGIYTLQSSEQERMRFVKL